MDKHKIDAINHYHQVNLSQDIIHGYIPFVSSEGCSLSEVSERELIDSPWVQRLRQIHQLQTAWWVFPSAVHTRFQHVLGAMHTASRMIERLYPSLCKIDPATPSRAYVESLMRVAALLHDVGHGPFGHFFDTFFLSQYDLTHEILGAEIIRHELGDMIRKIRRNPNGILASEETLDPEEAAWLIVRPGEGESPREIPVWLQLLRGLFSGLYTVDNMDFVLRDALMTGYNFHAFDLERLLYYSFFTRNGLTVHQKGFPTLVRFISVRAELFRSVYFHRTVRAIDLSLQDAFKESQNFLFSGNPLKNLEEYLHLTDWSLLTNVTKWTKSEIPEQRTAGETWANILNRRIPWHLMAEKTILFQAGEKEQSTIFSKEERFLDAVRDELPERLRNIEIRVDLARHVHRPGTNLPAAGQNFLYDPSSDKVRKLEEDDIFRHLPQSYRICRIYARNTDHKAELARAMERLTSQSSRVDDLTNM
ncbi:MAG: HD domain-containing protein [Planctomycetaceae bacterium]|nr:HD domain-containing protein [Planctomycetaceae bacterium]